MTINGITYGISILPAGNLPYSAGYRYGAYRIKDGESHIIEFFKTRDEIQKWVNEHPEYGMRKEA